MKEIYLRRLLLSALFLLSALGLSSRSALAQGGATETFPVSIVIEPATGAGTVEVSSGYWPKKVYTEEELKAIPRGTTIDVTPKPAAGYAIGSMSLGGKKQEGRSFSTTVRSAIEVTITFVKGYKVTVDPTGITGFRAYAQGTYGFSPLNELKEADLVSIAPLSETFFVFTPVAGKKVTKAEAVLSTGETVALTPRNGYSLGQGFVYTGKEADATIKVTIADDVVGKITVDQSNITGYHAYVKSSSFYNKELKAEDLGAVSVGTKVFFKIDAPEGKKVSKVEAVIGSKTIALTPYDDYMMGTGFLYTVEEGDATIKATVEEHKTYKLTIDKQNITEVKIYKKGGYFYNSEVAEADLNAVDADAELFFVFTIATDKAIKGVDAVLASGEKVALKPHSDGLKGNGFIYKVQASDATITPNVVDNKPCSITLKAPEGAPAVRIEKTTSSFYWTGTEITDLTRIELGTKIRIYLPMESKDWVLDQILVDGNADLSVLSDYSGRYIEYVVEKSFEIETRFVKGVALNFLIKPAMVDGEKYFESLWIQDAATGKELNNKALRKNTKLHLCYIASEAYKLTKVVPVLDLEEQEPLEAKDGSYDAGDGTKVNYKYYEIQVAETDALVHLYFAKAGSDEEENFDVKIEDIEDEAAEAGCGIELAPEAEDEGVYAKGTKVTIKVKLGTGYTLKSIKAVNDEEQEVALTKVSDLEYNFVIQSNVTITPVFEKSSSPAVCRATVEKTPATAPDFTFEVNTTPDDGVWTGKVVDADKIPTGSLIRIIIPKETKEWTLYSMEIDGQKPTIEYDHRKEGASSVPQKYFYVEKTVTADFTIKATFGKPLHITAEFTEESDSNNISIYDETGTDEIREPLHTNTTYRAYINAATGYKIDRVVELKGTTESPLTLEKEVDGESIYYYVVCKLQESDMELKVYLSPENAPITETRKIAVEINPAEAKAAGCAIELSNANEDGSFNVGQKVVVMVTEKGGYKLKSLMLGTMEIKRDASGVFSFQVTENETLTATFVRDVKTFKVNVEGIDAAAKAAGCKVTLSPAAASYMYEEGATVTAMITLGKGYKSATLTANNGITLTKKSDLEYTFKVTGPVTLTATFTKDLAVDEVASTMAKVYPNPAREYVVVEGVTPWAVVEVYALDGVVVLRKQADAAGVVRLELAGITAGEYIVRAGAMVERILVQ